MALTVEDGTGLAAADSLGSVADAVTYLTARYGAANLFVAETDATKKDEWMRQGADFIQALYCQSVTGQRKTTTQAYLWPRLYATRTDGPDYCEDVPSDSVPLAFQYAQFEAANLLAAGSPLIPTTGSSRRLKKLDVLEFEYDDTEREQSFPQIERLVKAYIPNSGLLKVGRA